MLAAIRLVFAIALFVSLSSSAVFADLAVLNFGDSLTLQSSSALPSELGLSYDVHSLTTNARNTINGVQKINTWLNDPDGNSGTSHPSEWDIVRFNHGIWDAVPITGVISTTQEYLDNLTTMVSAINQHSPDATIIFSTSPLIDANRVTLDPPPSSGFVDFVTYNTRLTDFRNAVIPYLPTLGVTVDDKYGFYLDNSPSDFPLASPAHSNTGEYWHWDGIHFDTSYLQFEANQTATVIADVGVIQRSDLNQDGFLTLEDYFILDANSWTDMSSLTPEQTHLLGDLDGDLDSDIDDFQLFRTDYEYANSPGSFEGMLLSVPEPCSSALLVLGCLLGAVSLTRRGFRDHWDTSSIRGTSDLA